MRLTSCSFLGGDTGVAVMAGAVVHAFKCTFSRHFSSCVSVGTMSVAQVSGCSAWDSGAGWTAEACTLLTVEGSDVLRCNVGEFELLYNNWCWDCGCTGDS
jgi:hypothetical protein